VDGLLLLIERERCGETVDKARLKRLLRMLGSLGMYEPVFQPQFLAQSAAFYQREGERLLAELDVPNYLRHCEVHRPADRQLQSRHCRYLVSAVHAC
jgi:cullin-4